MTNLLARYREVAYTPLRVVLAFLYASHGLQKWFGWFGGHAMPLTSRLGAAAVIETILGTLIIVGLWTSCAAFVASGEMAVAYFIAHQPRGPLPILNGGEIAVALCFGFLYIATHGGGRWSIDAARAAGSWSASSSSRAR